MAILHGLLQRMELRVAFTRLLLPVSTQRRFLSDGRVLIFRRRPLLLQQLPIQRLQRLQLGQVHLKHRQQRQVHLQPRQLAQGAVAVAAYHLGLKLGSVLALLLDLYSLYYWPFGEYAGKSGGRRMQSWLRIRNMVNWRAIPPRMNWVRQASLGLGLVSRVPYI